MLKLENITKYYYSSSSVTCALSKINLEFKLGEFVAITGESGSGKSTLLNIISGFDSYEDGELYFNNQTTSYFDEADWEQYRKNEISFIFQNYALIESYTVLQNVAITYVLDGYPYKEAKEKAMEKLKLVGLEKDINKKTSKLSGGQKQRLAIARALAKETNIIVADEPTGNLDEANGVKVLEILKQVSKEKLVIVVTHNIAQIEPFITRKVRLHDGHVVVDEIKEEINDIELKEFKNKDEKHFKKAINFSFLNIISQPIKSILLLSLILLCVFSSFIFYGNFKIHLDDNKTKNLDYSLFQNMDDTRLLVGKKDFSVVTDEILKDAYIDKVVSIEKYDYITDVNYYRPDSYKFIVDSEIEDPMTNTIVDYSRYELKDHSHFMRSSSSLTEDMLAAGRLPENDMEMVVYSNNLNILDTSEVVLFHNEKKMGINVSYKYNIKIVGILKERTRQAYFSDYLCKMMDITQYDISTAVTFENEKFILGETNQKTVKVSRIVIDPSLSGNQMALGANFKEYYKHMVKPKRSNVIISFGKLPTTNITFDLSFDKNYDMDISPNAIAISREVFNELYKHFSQKTQFALFIDDYTSTDKVIDALVENGYNAISCFRSSVIDYDINKLVTRYVNLAISILGLVLINVITFVLVYSIQKLRRNDYLIFKFNGLTNKLSKIINYLDMIIYGLIANVLLIIVASIVRSVSLNDLIMELFKRITIFDYILIFVISMITVLTISNKFIKYLQKFTKISSMRED